VAVSLSPEGEFEGHSLYNSTTLASGHLAGFPLSVSGATDGVESDDGKSLVFLGGASAPVGRVAAIRVLALVRIRDSSDSRPGPATRGEALRRLAPDTVVTRAVPPQACLSRMTRLVDQVPSCWLDLNRDLTQIPLRVERLLAEAVPR
jgi:hypothetical protein